jgi:hypothetical protein
MGGVGARGITRSGDGFFGGRVVIGWCGGGDWEVSGRGASRGAVMGTFFGCF